MWTNRDDHARRCAELRSGWRAGAGELPLGLSRHTGNLFRDRREPAKQRLDLSAFRHVLAVDPIAGWVDVEGSVTYEALVEASLPHGVMPAVVPQLKTITVGGAVAGVGIEATSFREGLVHDTMLELEVLLPDGRILTCTPDNADRELFFGFPNSYGTLGYALRVRLRTRPVKRGVLVEHRRYRDATRFFSDLVRHGEEGAHDFIDGVVFDDDTLVLNLASFDDAAADFSDYGAQAIYYRSLLTREVDRLGVRGYLWRWDTDWFWCSKNVGAQHPWVRRLLGRSRLNSRTYTRLMRWNARLGLSRRWAQWRGHHPESVVQDVDIPIDRAAEFLAFLRREIGILPVWICPLRAPAHDRAFTLYPLVPRQWYVNFGFWDVVDSRTALPAGHYNRLVESTVLRLGGIKSLYSDSFFTREQFDAAYGMAAYQGLKSRYDPGERLLGLYEKCVLGA